MGLLARVAPIAGAVLCALLGLAGCGDVVVVRAGSDREARRVVFALSRVGVAAHAERAEGAGAFDIEVDLSDVARAVAELERLEIPREEPPGVVDTYEHGPILPTVTGERARAAQAVGGELARTFESWPGVIAARVHVASIDPLTTPLDATEPAHPRASVVLHVDPAAPAPSEEAVRRVVVGAVTGMSAEDVTVVSIRRPRSSDGPEPFVWVGPIAVARGSVRAMIALVAGGAALVVALGSFAIAMRRRAAR